MSIAKTIIALTAAALAHTALGAQDLKPFFPTDAGTVLEYIQTDADGNPLMFVRDSVAEFIGDFNDGHATIFQSSRFISDTLVMEGTEYIRFDDYEVIKDLGTTMEESLAGMMKQAITMAGGEESDLQEAEKIASEVTTSGECRGIPSGLAVGMELPDYSMEVKIMVMKMTVNCRDRKVVGRENLTTPAGTFDCFIVEETTSVRSMMARSKTTTRTWYATGIGMVRQEMLDKKKTASVMELTAIR